MKTKKKGSIFKSLLIFTLILVFINAMINICIGNFTVNMYYMSDMQKYMEEQRELIMSNYNSVKTLDIEYSIYDMRIEQYDTLNNKIIYSSLQNRVDKNISSTLMTEELNSTFDTLLTGKEYKIFTINNNSEYSTLDNLLKNETEQAILLSKYSENNYFILEIPTPSIVYATTLSRKYESLTIFFSCIVIIPIVMAFSYFFVKPIKALSKQMNKLKDMNFEGTCEIKSDNEIGQLADSINDMSSSISSYLLEIKEKNAQLEKDIAIKKQFEESQKNFISNVSHEIKTPISIISAYTESLKFDLVKEKEKDEYYNVILDECNRMSNITKQLLHLSKLESTIKSLNMGEFDIVQMVKDDIMKFSVKCEQNGIKIILINSLDTAMTIADSNEIENVIINYLQNAFKYCLSPGIIRVSIIEEKDWYYVGIYNNANFLTEEQQEKIWERFYKDDKSRTRNEDSTGLGLSIVKATMNLHELPFGVVNKDEGVEFYIKLKKHKNNI